MRHVGRKRLEKLDVIVRPPGQLAERTREEFYPKESLQLTEVKGLDLTLKQALEFKYITAPLSVTDVQNGLIDILYKP